MKCYELRHEHEVYKHVYLNATLVFQTFTYVINCPIGQLTSQLTDMSMTST